MGPPRTDHAADLLVRCLENEGVRFLMNSQDLAERV